MFFTSFTIQYEQREGGMWSNKDVNVGYVPDGMSVHEWHEFQRAEVCPCMVFGGLLYRCNTHD